MKRSLVTVLSTLLATGLLALAPQAPASADPPMNDSIAQARSLGAPPRTYRIDTSQATGSSDDGECVLGASVWFRAKPSITRDWRFSTLGSDYDTTLAVFRGPRDARTQIACADDSFSTSPAAAAQVRLVAGRTYWIAVSACCGRRAPGGDLVLRTSLPQPNNVSVKVDDVRTGAVSGRLLVDGTLRCTTPSEVYLSLTASQRVNGGANVARGYRDEFFECVPGANRPWTARLDSDTGWAFRTGEVAVTTATEAWDGFVFVQVPESTSILTVTEQPAARSR